MIVNHSLSRSFCNFRMVFLHSSNSLVNLCIALSLIARSTLIPRIVANRWASSLAAKWWEEIEFSDCDAGNLGVPGTRIPDRLEADELRLLPEFGIGIPLTDSVWVELLTSRPCFSGNSSVCVDIVNACSDLRRYLSSLIRWRWDSISSLSWEFISWRLEGVWVRLYQYKYSSVMSLVCMLEH